jgi:hypothetical protein
VPSEFSTGEILWLSLVNGRTSSRKGTRSYAKLEIGSKTLYIRDHGLQESQTSVHGKKMGILCGPRALLDCSKNLAFWLVLGFV